MKFNINFNVMGVFGSARVGKSYFVSKMIQNIKEHVIVIDGSLSWKEVYPENVTIYPLVDISYRGLDKAIIDIRANYEYIFQVDQP